MTITETKPEPKKFGQQRTDLSCTECSKSFIAMLDLDVNGNHIIECPHCTHEHCRVIENGKVTGERWSSRHQRVDVEPRYVWAHQSIGAQTSSASHFIRSRWLNRSDNQDNKDDGFL